MPDRETSAGQLPVLEVGGTHVSCALVHPSTWTVTQHSRVPLDSNADAEHILTTFVEAGARLAPLPGSVWGVAMPDPFDYARGIATFRDVGKFDAIYGVDVGAVLRDRLPARPSRVSFVNDADAFILGEWSTGAARGFCALRRHHPRHRPGLRLVGGRADHRLGAGGPAARAGHGRSW